MKAVIEDDWSKLAGYHTWNMFPFGRMGYDVLGKGGLIENPARAVEKMTGLPYLQFPREVKKHQDEEFIHPRIL